MIKTIINQDTEKLDQEVNKFMSGRNLAVRTEAYVVPNIDVGYRAYHKAVIFYNAEEDKPKAKPEKIGALWKYGDTLKGKLNGEEHIVIKISQFKELPKITKGNICHKETEYKGNKIKIYKNEYKKEDKHPDFVIYRG